MSLPRALPWQAAQLARFRAARQAGRVSHAMLLSGPSGVGKRAFADTVAASLFCEQPSADFDACGTCRSCTLFAAGTHPDWSLLQPEEDKRDIAIESVRGLCERLAQSAQLRRAKIACFDPADALNTNGINALLKTVEEPPPDSYVLLLSARPQALPATLRSRCQRIEFPVPSAADAEAWLALRLPDSEPARRKAALKLAFGAPMTAAALLESGGVDRAEEWRRILDELAAGRVDPLAAAARALPDRDTQKEDSRAFVRCLLLESSDRLRAQLLSGASGQPSAAGLDRLQQGCLDTLRNLDRNANILLAIESLMLAWRALFVRRAETA